MKPIIGIYKITSPSGKIYIGQSVDIYRRWNDHRRDMKVKSKGSKIKSSFIKHGFENHKFEILEECTFELINEREKYYIDLFQTFNSEHGLNLRDGGGNAGSLSESTKNKLRILNIGKKHSEESLNKLKLAMNTEEVKNKCKKPHIGKKHSKEKIESMSNIILNTQNGIYYIGTKEAADSVNTSRDILYRILSGSRRRLKNNYFFINT